MIKYANEKIILLLFLITILYSCGSNFDILGKGKKASCLYVDIDEMKLKNSCNDTTMRVIDIENRDRDTSVTIFYKRYENIGGVWSLDLPISRDSLLKGKYYFYIRLWNSEHREAFHIDTSPKVWEKGKRAYARFTYH